MLALPGIRGDLARREPRPESGLARASGRSARPAGLTLVPPVLGVGRLGSSGHGAGPGCRRFEMVRGTAGPRSAWVVEPFQLRRWHESDLQPLLLLWTRRYCRADSLCLHRGMAIFTRLVGKQRTAAGTSV